MMNASKEFKEKLNKGVDVVNYADVTLRDGTVLHLEPKDFMIGGCAVEDSTTDGKFGVGCVIGKTISIKLANHDERFSDYDFYKAYIYLYVAMQLDDGTIEKVRKGKYYVINPETPGEIIKISGVDSICLLDRPFKVNEIFPATLQDILSQCCLDCGINIGFGRFDNCDFVAEAPMEELTYRQVVSYAAQIAGYNVRISNDDAMELVWYNRSVLDMYNINGGTYKKYNAEVLIHGGTYTDHEFSTIISAGNFTDERPEQITAIKELSVSTDDIKITGVRVVNGESSYLFGEEGYLLEVKDNPFCEGKEEQIAKYLGDRINGMVFRIFSAKVLGNPLYEPFDTCMVFDCKGNGYVSIINSVSYNIGSFTTIACKAEEPARNESSYVSPFAQAVVKARRETKREISSYDKAVQNMNKIAGNALGFHTTYEEQADGSRITYLHDKPNLSESKIIYKQTIDGFFISQDGGKSYTAGFDSQGNAVVNVLYAIGIVADWIRGGVLTLGGDNNISGKCSVLDAEGSEVVRLDKEGLTTNSATITGGSINIETGNEAENKIVLSYSDEVKIKLSPSELELSGVEQRTNINRTFVRVDNSSTGLYSMLTSDSFRTNGLWSFYSDITESSHVSIGDENGFISFFGTTGSQRRSVTELASNASTSTCIVKINEIISALKAYGLIL